MYFGNYGLRKTWFDKYLKALASDDTLTLLKSEQQHLYHFH